MDFNEDGSDFAALLGSFGTHNAADKVKKRAKAERLAIMKKGDGRRNREVTRPHQFNVRVDEVTKKLAKILTEKLTKERGGKVSEADIVIEAIALLAKSEKVSA